MPVASSSRLRRSRAHKELSLDKIEEDTPTQRTRDDVDGEESDEEQPEHTATKVAKKDRKGKGRAVQRDEDQAEESENESDRIDVENFYDQPLDRKDGGRLHSIAQDWELIRKQIHQGSYSLVQGIAMTLADVIEVGQSEEALEEVDVIMRQLLDIEKEMLSHEETLKELHQKIMREERVENVMDKYESAVGDKMNLYHTKTSRQKYGPSEVYTQFKQGIFEVQNPGVPIPPINEFIPSEDGDASDDEDDLEVGGVTQDYRCPITLTTLVNPMTSTICGHSFSAAAIQEYIKNARACPASGCRKMLTMAVLKYDKDLEKKVKIAARQRRRQEEHSDDGEVVE